MEITRRHLLGKAAVAAAVAGSLHSPFRAAADEGKPGAGIKLGLDTYSIRSSRLSPTQLIEYGAKTQFDIVQISVAGLLNSPPTEIAALKQQAERAGVEIEAGTGCICPSTKAWNPKNAPAEQFLAGCLRVAKALDSSILRCFMGSDADRGGAVPIEAHMENTIKVLRAVRSQAMELGIRIAVENHKDMTARELKWLIETAGKDFVGACLDTGNPVAIGEDPALTIDVLGPVTVSSHFRDSVVYEHPRGAQFQWVALGDGCVNITELVGQFKRAAPGVPVQLEIITGRPPAPIPYLDAEYWQQYPKVPAADFARFVKLVKQGRPFAGTMLTAIPGKLAPEFQGAFREQERMDLERSVAYARGTLGLGLRGRG